MQVDHRLLHRMQHAVAREVFDRDDLAAVGLAGEQDAGIDRLVDEPLAAQPPQHHRAGAAVALGAAFLGAGRAFGQAQVVEQRERRRSSAKLHHLAAPQEADFAAHQLPR